MKRILLSFLLLFSCGINYPESSSRSSIDPDNAFTVRKNYHARLELQDKVYHGAGQDISGFRNYYTLMNEGKKPLIYIYYTGLKWVEANCLLELKGQLEYYETNFGNYIIPQIGLSMTVDGSPQYHYEQDVAAGLYDKQIDILCDEIEGLGHPVLVRIGYEFNGFWNGYLSNTYKLAYQRITDAFRARNLEAATIWCVGLPGSSYMEFYPGDSYVDWWGIDLFAVSDFNHDAELFVSNADAHGKPVIIGESTPKSIGVLDGESDWNAWFVPYFSFIQTGRTVKAFCYINWNWANYPQWSDWGDARLEQNSTVAGHYKNRVNSVLFQHGTTEKGLRKAFGINDETPPSAATGLIAVLSNNNQVLLRWDAASDGQGILRYEVYNNSNKIRNTTRTNYSDCALKAGDSASYSIKAVDIGGNKSGFSTPASLTIPNTIEKAFNGEFDLGKDYWGFSTFEGGSGIFTNDSTSKLNGVNSAKIIITNSTGINWHIQLSQPFASHAGMRYIVTFKIASLFPSFIDVFLQQRHDPYSYILAQTLAVSATPQTFVFTNSSASQEDNMGLSFMMGNCSTNTIWIDSVSLKEEKL
jgi:hypothetical protein